MSHIAIKINTKFRVGTYPTFNQVKPLSSSLSNGGFVVIWSDTSANSMGRIYGQLYNTEGWKSGAKFNVTGEIDIIGYPSLSSLKSGGFVVTWHVMTDNRHYHNIYGQIYSDAGVKYGEVF